MRKLVCALAMLCTVSVLPAGGALDRAQGKMTTYQLVVFSKGPTAATASTPAGQAILKDHVAYLYKLAAEGRAMAGGPFTDGGEIQGILMLKADTPEAALEIQGADPAVKAGIFSVEALPLLLPEGWFGKWAAFGSFETVYFGFLKRGPNRSQDPETAKQLQKEHLAYMEGQSARGKLVVAGPFMVDGDRRGIVVYRAPTMDEAKQWAEADPMVKVRRLVVELHPWQVPMGALPTRP